MSETNTGAAPAEETFTSDLGLEWYPAEYRGDAELAGATIPANGHLLGTYAETGNSFLFRPDGTTLIFNVSDLDIKRNPATA